MIRLNLNEHTNINDGINQSSALSSLGQNYPNPFNRTTDISYQLAKESDVKFIVRDLTGRIVAEKSEGSLSAGKHLITIDASSFESGIYFYTINAGNFQETKRMTVSK